MITPLETQSFSNELASMAAQDSTLLSSQLAQRILSYEGMDGKTIATTILSDAIQFGFKILGALLLFFIGMWAIKKLRSHLKKRFSKALVDASLSSFIISTIYIILIAALIITIIGVLGINTTSFAALIASGGVAIGVALSGALENFAGGIMIFVFKPFKSGDFIKVDSYEGFVEQIDITTTKIRTYDLKTIIIPNKTMISTSIENRFTRGRSRVQWTIAMSYGDDFDAAKAAILSLFEGDSRILSDPAPSVALSEMADSSIVLSVKVWVESDSSTYWAVQYDYNEKFYRELPKAGIHFPYPHLTVDIQQNQA